MVYSTYATQYVPVFPISTTLTVLGEVDPNVARGVIDAPCRAFSGFLRSPPLPTPMTPNSDNEYSWGPTHRWDTTDEQT